MDLIRRFLSQPSKDYRDFQIVFGFLALQFILPALACLLSPDAAVAGFVKIGTLLGRDEIYPLYEKSYLWRILAATNILTLGFLCLFLQADVERHWPAIYPLLFMKGATAVCFFFVYAFVLHYPAFLIVASWDTLNCAAFLYFGSRGLQAAMSGADGLVPKPPRG